MQPTPYSPIDAAPVGPTRLVILGPPGSGKTQTLVNDFLTPALERAHSQKSVVALSFSKAAATVIRDRISGVTLPLSPSKALICSTLHSLANSIIQKPDFIYIPSRGLFRPPRPSDSKVSDLDEDSSALEERPRDHEPDPLAKYYDPALYKAAIDLLNYKRSVLHRKSLSEALQQFAFPFDLAEIESVQDDYKRTKKKFNAIDFTDMLELALEVKDEFLPTFDFLALDESQDCNPLQWKFFLRLAEKSARTVIFGDSLQTIYGWAGASIDAVADLARAGFEIRYLTQSRRISAEVKDTAVSMLRPRSRSQLTPYHPTNHRSTIRDLTLPELIHKLRPGREGSKCGTQVFLLHRTNEQARRTSKLLWRERVPNACDAAPHPIYEDRVLVARARAALAIHTNTAPDPRDLGSLLDNLPRSWRDDAFYSGTRRPKTPACDSLTIEAAELVGFDLTPLARCKSAYNALRAAGIHDDVAADIDQLLLECGPDILSALDRILVMTMHMAKGQEAAEVVVFDEMPMQVRRLLENDSNLEEEGRLLYVACTRTKGDLFFVGRDYRDAFGL